MFLVLILNIEKKHLQKQTWAKYSCEKIIKPDTSNNPPHEDDSKNYHFIYIMTKGKFNFFFFKSF